MIQHPSGTLDLHILVMTEDAAIVMKLLTLGGDFGRVGYIPAGFTVLDVFLNLDVPCPLQSGDRQIAAGLIPVKIDKETHQGDDDREKNKQRAFAFRSSFGLRLGRRGRTRRADASELSGLRRHRYLLNIPP